MTVDIIPNKIAPIVIKKGIYKDIILYALAAFGELETSKFVNNPKKKIENKLNKKKFQNTVEELVRKEMIEIINRDDPSLKITSKGEDYFIERMKEYPQIMEVFKKFDKSLY